MTPSNDPHMISNVDSVSLTRTESQLAAVNATESTHIFHRTNWLSSSTRSLPSEVVFVMLGTTNTRHVPSPHITDKMPIILSGFFSHDSHLQCQVGPALLNPMKYSSLHSSLPISHICRRLGLLYVLPKIYSSSIFSALDAASTKK